jgi:hypothetical protein
MSTCADSSWCSTRRTFVVSDPEGHYRLSGLPPGHYTLKAWIDSKTTLERAVELRDGVTLNVDFP